MRCYCLECDAPVETEDLSEEEDDRSEGGDTYPIECPECGCTKGYEG